MSPSTGHDASGYWYANEQKNKSGTAVLNAMRSYRVAEGDMRRRTQSSMKMGESDLAAVRMMFESRESGVSLSPTDLAKRLHISTASTTLLIDRLVLSGHVVRNPHPTDRRSVVLTPTEASNDEVKSTLGAMHDEMMDVAKGLSLADAKIILGFFRRMNVVVSDIR